MGSPQWTLQATDFARGAAVAVFAAVFVAIVGAAGSIIGNNFDAFTTDWGAVGKALVNVSIISGFGAFSGYVGKNFMSDESGKLFGRI